MKKKKGISLIVLIVTIIVIIILAAAVILTISKNNPVENAKEATFKEDVRTFQDELAMTISKEYIDLQGQRDEKITTSDFAIIKSKIPSFTEKYKDKFVIENDKLVATDELTEKEKSWVESLNVDVLLPSYTNYTEEEIDASEYLYAIGKTKPEYVVAKFNEDYSEVIITKNFKESDGVIQDFAPWSSSSPSPMTDKRDTLKKAVIKSGITHLGDGGAGRGTFSSCINLTSVTIPGSVTVIGEDTFDNCSNLTNITIPNSVTSIGDFAFSRCSSLTNITIPDSVTSIGSSAFSGCSGLTSITVSNRVTRIEYNTFSDCSSLTNIIIPDSVTSIGQYVFYGCSSLASITIPDSVTSIGSSAFEDTVWYNNKEDGLVYINNILYKYKGNMPANTSITIKDGINCINQDAFSGCISLTSITIPDSVTSIGTSAFSECSGLTSITIPNSVTSIGNASFRDCSSLTNIEFKGTINEWNNINRDSYWKKYSVIQTITCTDGVITL